MENKIRLLKITDILQFAITAEENQLRFYRKASEVAENNDLKDTFEFLANEEIEHKKHFEKMLKGVSLMKIVDDLPEGYFEYLNAFIEDINFIENNFDHILSKIKTTEQALAFAINHEAEFLLYYLELKGMIPESEHSIIDKIINEERKHFTLLSNIKSNLYQLNIERSIDAIS